MKKKYKTKTMNTKERLKYYIKCSKISVLYFEKSISASNGYVSSIQKSIGGDKLILIQKVYKDLNITWLLTGVGEMLIEHNSSNAMNGTKERLKSFINYKKINVSAFEKSISASNGYVNNIVDTLSTVKIKVIQETYPDLNLTWLLTGVGEMIIDDNSNTVDISNSYLKLNYKISTKNIEIILSKLNEIHNTQIEIISLLKKVE